MGRFAVKVEEDIPRGDLYELEQTTFHHVVDCQSGNVVMTFKGFMETSLSTSTGNWDDCRFSGVCEVTISGDERSVNVRYFDGHIEMHLLDADQGIRQ